MARVFITGGGGFLGKALARRLVDCGHAVSVLARAGGGEGAPEGARIVRGELGKGGGTLVPRGTEIVYHLAAQSNVPDSTANPTGTFDINVMGTARLLEEVRTRKIALDRFVLASTGHVYGPPFAGRLREDHPLLPRNVYSASKAAAEHYAVACAALYRIPVSVVRLFNVYGPGQRSNFVVPTVLAQCLWSKELRIGNAWPVRDFLHLDDAVRLFELVGTKAGAEGEVINAGSGRGTAIHDMVEAAKRATGADLEVKSEAKRSRANDFDRLVADASKAKRLLGWSARVSLLEGLKKTAAAMREEGKTTD